MQDFGEEILRYPLRLLKICGQNPRQKKSRVFSIVAAFSIYLTISLGFFILQLFYTTENKTVAVSRTCEGLSGFGQALFKSLALASKLNDFRQIITDTRRFWKTNRFEKNIRKELEDIFERTLQIQKLFFRLLLITVLMELLNSYFKRELITGAWAMKDQQKLFRLFLTSQQIVVPYIALHAVAFESFFLSLGIHLMVQFKMLRYSLQELNTSIADDKIDVEVYLKKLISCIHHHKFILRFSSNFKDVYSLVMLLQYSTVAIFSFVEMYGAFTSDNIVSLLRYTGAFTAALLQLSMYCVPLNYITDEATSVAQGIYESGWNLKHTSAVKSIIPFVIQRSQKEIIFTAGGLVIMNCRTVLNVMRMSYSLCTVMRAMETN